MEIIRTHTFSHPIAECWAMFNDPESHLAKFTAMGHRDIELISVEQDDVSIRLEIERLVDVDVPGFARKVIKPTNSLKSVDEWYELEDGTYAGTFELQTKGVPIETGGHTRLWADGDNTGYEVTVTLDVKVPLIGGRIASYSKGIIERQLADEFRLGDEWLDSHAG